MIGRSNDWLSVSIQSNFRWICTHFIVTYMDTWLWVVCHRRCSPIYEFLSIRAKKIIFWKCFNCSLALSWFQLGIQMILTPATWMNASYFEASLLSTHIPLCVIFPGVSYECRKVDMSTGGAPKCPRCQERVYFNEEKKALGKSWHTKCFTCGEWLSSFTAAELQLWSGECPASHQINMPSMANAC